MHEATTYKLQRLLMELSECFGNLIFSTYVAFSFFHQRISQKCVESTVRIESTIECTRSTIESADSDRDIG